MQFNLKTLLIGVGLLIVMTIIPFGYIHNAEAVYQRDRMELASIQREVRELLYITMDQARAMGVTTKIRDKNIENLKRLTARVEVIEKRLSKL